MTLTNGASAGGGSVGSGAMGPGGIPPYGFDTTGFTASANMQIMLQTNNDLLLAIHKAFVDSTQEINRKIEALRDDIRDIKLNQQRNDRTLQEEANMWRSHTEHLLNGQGDRHMQDVSRLQDMMMKVIIGQPSQAQSLVPPPQPPPPPQPTGAALVTTKVVSFAQPVTTSVPASTTVTIPKAELFGGGAAGSGTASIVPPTPSVTTSAPAGFTPSIPSVPLNTSFFGGGTGAVTIPIISSAPSVTNSVPVGFSPNIAAAQTKTSLFGGGSVGVGNGINTFANLAAKAAEGGGGGFLSGGGASGGMGGKTFANFAAKAAETGGGGFLSGGGASGGTVGKPLFGASPFGGGTTAAKDFKLFATANAKASHDDSTGARGGDGSDKEDEEAAEDYTPDIHYEPVVPLPPEVEIVSGEEGEEVLFMARCKLYRYDRETKENKERGLGDIKILLNPETNKFRCVMRREKVLKICANFPIVADLHLHKRDQMPTVYTWACKDFAEDPVNGMDETFSARFRDANIANDFFEKMTEAINSGQ